MMCLCHGSGYLCIVSHFCNQAFAATNAVVHMMHQVACGKLAKAEFMVGLMTAIARASGKDKPDCQRHDSRGYDDVRDCTGIAVQCRSTGASDQWGNYIPLRSPIDTSRNLFPKMYPRMVEILQLLGSSSLMATPSEADFSNDISEDVARYFQLAHADSKDRVALFRLAHDVCISGFGNRQALYERFFLAHQPS